MHIEPLPAGAITDPELQALVDHCAALGVPDAVLPRILARVPDYAKALLRALVVSHAEGNVDHKLKEVTRVQLARTAGDPYFGALRSSKAREAGLSEETIAAGSGKFEDDPRFTPAEKWALRYAHEMYLNPERIDAAFY